jgi:UDP-N-acetylmuramate--alanine ligase
MNTAKRIHFIGIGGIGMSALARFFLYEKKHVSGSDRTPSDITNALEREGVVFFGSQVAANITPDIELVVYTEAMASDHEEMVAARSLGVPMVNYFEALGMIANDYYLIAVAGAHGKTTTTAMLIDILEAAGLDPTAVVGSLRAKTGSNFRAGKSQYAVVEACEFKRDFLYLQPDVLVITNIDFEHVDYYKDLPDVQSAFRTLAEKVSAGGYVVAETAHPNVAPILKGLSATVVDYGEHIDLTLPLKLPGLHNRMNAAAASAAAQVIGVSREVSAAALSAFTGTWRRFEYKGEVNGAPLYDDYAHHPTEIAATIKGVRELYPDKKLLLVFQSHTYSRTHELFDDFARALAKADHVLMLPIYAAREVNESGVSAEKLVEAIKEKGTTAEFSPTLKAAADRSISLANPDYVIVVMGAGEVTEVATMLAN